MSLAIAGFQEPFVHTMAAFERELAAFALCHGHLPPDGRDALFEDAAVEPPPPPDDADDNDPELQALIAFAIKDTSMLGEYLLEMWAFGSMSAQQVQEISTRAVQDGLRLPMLEFLAGIGSQGTTSKCDRDIRRHFPPRLALPETLTLTTKLMSTKTDPPQLVDVRLPILPIHELFHCMQTELPFLN